MSASICYRIVEPETKCIGCYAPSSFMSALEKAGIGIPYTFDKKDVDVLRGMAATFGDGPNPYQEILDLIEKHDKIEVWAQY